MNIIGSFTFLQNVRNDPFSVYAFNSGQSHSEFVNMGSEKLRFGGMLPFFLFIFAFTEHTYNILYIILVEYHSWSLHCFRSVEGLLWGAEPRFELGPAKQQADALLSETRRTLTETRRTLAETRRTLTETRRTLSETRRTLPETRRTLTWETPHPNLRHAAP
jgi:hypothetical protein